MAALNSGNVDNALRQKFRLKWKLLHLPIGAINLLKVIEGRPRGCPRLIIFKPAIGRYDYWLMLLKTVRILAVDEMIWITRRCRNTQWFYFHFSRHQNIFMSSEDVSQNILRCFFFFFPKSQVPSLSKKGSFDSDLDFPGWLQKLILCGQSLFYSSITLPAEVCVIYLEWELTGGKNYISLVSGTFLDGRLNKCYSISMGCAKELRLYFLFVIFVPSSTVKLQIRDILVILETLK